MSSATTSRQRLLDRLSDEDLGREFAVLWERYWIENVPFTINGERVPEISDTQLEQILPTSKVLSRIAIFDQDTDNEGLMGVQRALQLGASGYYIRAGRIFRAYIERVDEARTGRRRRPANRDPGGGIICRMCCGRS